MTNVIEIARPYAQAAFEYAAQHKQLDLWLKNLQNLAKAVQNPLLQEVINNPRYTPHQLADICIGVSKDWNQAGYNFIRLLADNRRLLALSGIADLFEKFCKEKENIMDVEVYSAITLDDSYREKLMKVLQKKLKRQIMLHYKEEPSLIGGVVLRINDWVVDGSIKGQFERLRTNIVD